jgi:thioredoxin reductase
MFNPSKQAPPPPQVVYDLAVIGAGPVGVTAALAAAARNKKVVLIDAPRASGMLMNEVTGEDLSLGGPTGLFGKALRDSSKRIKVATLRGMGLREER